MKTKEVIRLLQEADPTGEEECCVCNEDILYIDRLPAYYDGRLQVLIRDEKGKVIGGKYKSSGDKVCIYPSSFHDRIESDVNFPIDYSDLSYPEEYIKCNDEWRERVKEIENEVERSLFAEYLLKRVPCISISLAERFYDENLNYKDPVPEDIKEECRIGYSFNDMRNKQWDREIEVDITDGILTLKVNREQIEESY